MAATIEQAMFNSLISFVISRTREGIRKDGALHIPRIPTMYACEIHPHY
jgi:hypothetical protein